MDVVTWNTPVTTAQSASAQIGVLGGQISRQSLGLTVIVPAFAVTSTTTITVTAVPGNQVAYEFGPHGLQFNAPVIVRQSLAGTSALQQNGVIPAVLEPGHSADVSALNQLNGTALVDEILRVSIDRVLGSATFDPALFGIPAWHWRGRTHWRGGDAVADERRSRPGVADDAEHTPGHGSIRRGSTSGGPRIGGGTGGNGH